MVANCYLKDHGTPRKVWASNFQAGQATFFPCWASNFFRGVSNTDVIYIAFTAKKKTTQKLIFDQTIVESTKSDR